MEFANVGGSAVLEILVMFCQVLGVAGLTLSRLAAAKWAERGRLGFVLAMIGLGLSGALLGVYDSEFALFAGGTMTVLLVGLTIGGHATEPHIETGGTAAMEAALVN
jgi:hypothetical protein